MSTAISWTELRRGTADLRILVGFRRAGVSRASLLRMRAAAILVGGATAAVMVLPGRLRDSFDGTRVGDVVAVLPALYLGFAILAALAAIAAAGGRELVPRDQAVSFPISPIAEHGGALLLAPLNIAWLVEAWMLLGATSYVLGPLDPARLALALAPVVAWIALATACGQIVGWWFEGIRRGPRGLWQARGIAGAVAAGAVGLVWAGWVDDVLDASPTVRIYLAVDDGLSGHLGAWAGAMAALGLATAAATVLGAVPARWALARPERAEQRLESAARSPRPRPRSDLGAMLRLDRASIWRAVPFRRGLAVLALMPAAIAFAGDLTWDVVVVLPGLVASGAMLLFGVNSWSLDGKGALWRDSLPVAPRVAFWAKALVLGEVALVAALPTVVFAGLRAGMPNPAELAAVAGATVVVVAHVVAICLHWSVHRPFAVDLRSARATPAPPVVMAGYSARLAGRTTIIGLLFSVAAKADGAGAAVALAVPLVLWAGYRLARAESAWIDPGIRARVVAVVAS